MKGVQALVASASHAHAVDMPDQPDLLPGITTAADGSLSYRDYGGSHDYIAWDARSPLIVLDGHYTVDDLRKIIAHMEAHGKTLKLSR